MAPITQQHLEELLDLVREEMLLNKLLNKNYLSSPGIKEYQERLQTTRDWLESIQPIFAKLPKF